MNTNGLILLLSLSACLCSCQSREQKATIVKEDYQEDYQIDSSSIVQSNWIDDSLTFYLQNFKTINLPIVIKHYLINSDSLKEFKPEEYPKFNRDYSYAYAQISTNGNYVAVITLGIADCYLPVLTTYTFEGKVIDEQTIAIGYNTDCMSFMTIRDDYTIYTADTVIEYKDDDFEEDAIVEEFIIYRTGQLLPTGKIELSAERKKVLQRRED